MGNSKPIIIGSDHAAFALKEKIRAFVADLGYAVQDAGTFSEASVDYADIGSKVAAGVSRGDYRRGILLCGTGLGMSMVANRFPHVRAALCTDLFAAIMSRSHNDANILVLGGRTTGDILAEEIVRVWFSTPFDGGRHTVRIEKIDQVAPDAP